MNNYRDDYESHLFIGAEGRLCRAGSPVAVGAHESPSTDSEAVFSGLSASESGERISLGFNSGRLTFFIEFVEQERR